MKWLNHLRTVNHHRKLVRENCFRLGLYYQGLTHDLSKYSPVEFLNGIRYYQGDRSPNDGERKAKGYSAAWLHHKGRNKHHMEYWIDYGNTADHAMTGMLMPKRYVVEMFCDRVAASKTYRKEKYTDADPYNYYEMTKKAYIMHPESLALLEEMLVLLKDCGEEEAFRYIRKNILRKRLKRK